MKKILTLIAIIGLSFYGKSQIIIGDNAGSVPANNNALLSFTRENMGIILPIINTATENASSNNVIQVPGSLFVSRTDKQVKVYMLKSPQNLTGIVALTPKLPAAVVLPTANTSQESTDSGVIMGNTTSSATGVLVLENDQKTLVMPLIGTVQNPPYKAIKLPRIGTIGFAETENLIFPTTKPHKKLLWVFNGGDKSINGAGQWHMWRAGVEYPPSGTVIDQTYLDNLP